MSCAVGSSTHLMLSSCCRCAVPAEPPAQQRKDAPHWGWPCRPQQKDKDVSAGQPKGFGLALEPWCSPYTFQHLHTLCNTNCPDYQDAHSCKAAAGPPTLYTGTT